MNFTINVPVVESELTNLETYISQLEELSTKLQQINLESGWDSNIARTIIMPKLDTINEDVRQMRECVVRINANVSKYKSGVVSADEAGAVQG